MRCFAFFLLGFLSLAPLMLAQVTSDRPQEPPEARERDSTQKQKASPARAELKGRVRWLEAKAPRRRRIRMGSDPTCEALCGDEPRYDEAILVDKAKGLANVVVALDGLPEVAWPPAPKAKRVIDQSRCRFEPHVSALRLGTPLWVHNSDPTTHNVNLVTRFNVRFNRTMARESRIDITQRLKRPEGKLGGMRIECNIHPWMRAWVYAFDHPVYTVSAADGSFALPLKGVPDGTYELWARHSKLGFLKGKVKVLSESASAVELGFGRKDKTSFRVVKGN